MPLTLYVDGPRWRSHLRHAPQPPPRLVPVAKGNGYGFTVGDWPAELSGLAATRSPSAPYGEVAEVGATIRRRRARPRAVATIPEHRGARPGPAHPHRWTHRRPACPRRVPATTATRACSKASPRCTDTDSPAVPTWSHRDQRARGPGRGSCAAPTARHWARRRGRAAGSGLRHKPLLRQPCDRRRAGTSCATAIPTSTSARGSGPALARRPVGACRASVHGARRTRR